MSFVSGLVLLVAVQAAEFTEKPKVSRAGEKVSIGFAVSRETDVAVDIVDSGENVVRHLAAGRLGKQAPEPLQPGRLRQLLEWDGKDDEGQAAMGGPFVARVRLGLTPRFERFLLENPNATGYINSVATGPKGELYVVHSDYRMNGGVTGTTKIKLLDRQGAYVRTLAPFPADLPYERIKPLGVLRSEKGEPVPRIYNLQAHGFYPDEDGYNTQPVNDVPAVDGQGRIYRLIRGGRVACLDAEGGVPYETYLGPPVLPEVKDLNVFSPCLALSGDGRWLYLSGLSAGKTPLPCVYRVSVATRGGAEVFVGKAKEAGPAGGLLTAPRGLAVADGLIYVADRGADRIALFREADRSWVGEIKIARPEGVAVDRKTGAVYVCSMTAERRADLVKLSDAKSGKELYRATLPADGGGLPYVYRIALDASSSPPIVWVPPSMAGTPGLLRIEDRGTEFQVRGDPRREDLYSQLPRDVSVDRKRGWVYVKLRLNADYQHHWARLDEKTGKVLGTVKLSGQGNFGLQLVPVADGGFVTYASFSEGIRRFDADGKPQPWPGQSSHVIGSQGVMCFQMRNLALRGLDEIYVAPVGTDYNTKKGDELIVSLNLLGPDGKPRRTVVWQCLHGVIPRVDLKGNVYIAEMVKPPGRYYPEFFDGKVAPGDGAHAGDGGPEVMGRYYLSHMYGSIVKFPPSGGAVWYRKDLSNTAIGRPPEELSRQPKVKVSAYLGSKLQEAELQGALWYRFGFSPYLARSTGSLDLCICTTIGGFDVDGYGRVFYPNLGQFRVEAVDTNNNWIGSFGRYGNQDGRGPGAKSAGDGLSFTWPSAVAVSDRYAYVTDVVSQRVVQVKLDYAAEAASPVP